MWQKRCHPGDRQAHKQKKQNILSDTNNKDFSWRSTVSEDREGEEVQVKLLEDSYYLFPGTYHWFQLSAVSPASLGFFHCFSAVLHKLLQDKWWERSFITGNLWDTLGWWLEDRGSASKCSCQGAVRRVGLNIKGNCWEQQYELEITESLLCSLPLQAGFQAATSSWPHAPPTCNRRLVSYFAGFWIP